MKARDKNRKKDNMIGFSLLSIQNIFSKNKTVTEKGPLICPSKRLVSKENFAFGETSSHSAETRFFERRFQK